VQACVGEVEFAAWGPCEGAAGLDLDCDGSDTGGGGPGGSGDPGGGDDSGGDGPSCTAGSPPVLLVVLDRTQSMHKTPSGETPTHPSRSKWAIAIDALERVVPSFDASIAFGLELFPRAAAGCVTLEERLRGTRATNPSCEPGETVVVPAAGASAAIATRLDPLATELCNTTPIGLALDTARAALGGVSASTPRSILLVTDGRETCDSEPILRTKELALSGVKTYVVAFDEPGGIDTQRLNQLACAGRTARSFATNCVDEGGGQYAARDPDGAQLFHLVGDVSALEATLRGIASEVACVP
jgi:hypothetical protein